MVQRQRCAILVVDVIESVQRMAADEAGFIQHWLAWVRKVSHDVLSRRSGILVKSLGDGLLLRFEQVHEALGAAFELLALAETPVAGKTAKLALRMGLHVDEVYVDQIDIFGHAVNLAARLTALSRGGEVVVSAQARDELVDELHGDIEDLGDCYLKHVDRPVRAFRVTPCRSPGVVGGPSWIAEPAQLAPPSLPVGALAVLPFTTLLPQDSAVGQLVADGLICKLTGSSTLRVLSRLSTAALVGQPLGLPRIGELLGCQYVVSGSCQVLAGQRLRIQAELASVCTGHAVWCSVAHGSLDELLHDDAPLLAPLADAVAEALLDEEVRRARTQFLPTLDSSTLLIGSISLMHKQSTEDFGRARELLEQLTDRHPRHAAPRAWLGKWYALSAAQGWNQDRTDPNRARETIVRALDLDDTNALAWTIQGLLQGYMHRQFSEAEATLRQALVHNPNEPLAWLYLATVLGWMQREGEAVHAVHMAQNLSPLNPMRYYFDSLCAAALLGAQRPAEAVALAERSLRRNKAHVATYKVLAIAQMLAGNGAAAQTCIQAVQKHEANFSVARFLAVSPWGASPLADLFAAALLEAGTPAR